MAKSVWDYLDSVLPPVTNIYGKIRQQKTGVDPFAQKQEELPVELPEPTLLVEPPKSSAKTFVIVGGILVVGVATYFLIIKNKKNGQKSA